MNRRSDGSRARKFHERFGGSLSGEHGDGRLRGEFLPLMVGERNYALFCAMKRAWDPLGIFNPGNITDAPPMDASLRYEANQSVRQFKTVLRFSEARGILRAAEQCNGSGDCRKSLLMGGTMCPSYMATRNERDTTRARANILREVLTHSTKANPFYEDCRAGTAASGALGCSRHNDRRTRDELPPPDQRRHRTHRAPPGRDSARPLSYPNQSFEELA
jgi:hypothetical protein